MRIFIKYLLPGTRLTKIICIALLIVFLSSTIALICISTQPLQFGTAYTYKSNFYYAHGKRETGKIIFYKNGTYSSTLASDKFSTIEHDFWSVPEKNTLQTGSSSNFRFTIKSPFALQSDDSDFISFHNYSGLISCLFFMLTSIAGYIAVLLFYKLKPDGLSKIQEPALHQDDNQSQS